MTKIVQYFVGDNPYYQKLLNVSKEINQEYCKLHNYNYHFSQIDQSQIERWYGECKYDYIIAYKIKFILDQLNQQDCDYLVFIDSDAAVSKPTLKIEDLIDNQHELFLSHGNDIWGQLYFFSKIINNINHTDLNRFKHQYYGKQIINTFHNDFELMSVCSIQINEGFIIIKNTNTMRKFFSQCFDIQVKYLINTVHNCMSYDGRAICYMLQKKEYNKLYKHMYDKSQGGIANSFVNQYSEDETFLRHDYGTATTKEQKIYYLQQLKNNKWWKQVKEEWHG